MSVHVERVDREVIRREVQRLEHLAEREVSTITEDDHFLSSMMEETSGSRTHASETAGSGRLTSGHRFILLLMKRNMCFWFMLAEW